MNAFTQTVYEHLAADPVAMRETVRQWHASERLPELRVNGFAMALAEDHRTVGESLLDPLLKKFTAAAIGHVDWLAIAKRLLKRFGPRQMPRAAPEPSAN